MRGITIALVLALVAPAFAGCFSEKVQSIDSEDLMIEPEIITGAQFQVAEFTISAR